MTIDGKHEIGRGRSAEIYEWGEGRILKLFKEAWPAENAAREAETIAKVHAAGLRVPFVHGIEEINGRTGIVMERISGNILGDEFLGKPWLFGRYARIMAEVHARMHSVEIPGLPSFHAHLEGRVADQTALTRETTAAVLGLLDQLPRGNTLCHTDFYIDQVMLPYGTPVTIDWCTAGRGHPHADVARTWMLHRLATWPFGFPKRFLIDPLRALFHRAYLKRYLELRPAAREDITRWLIPILAARLAENVKGEKERFPKLIDSLLRRFHSDFEG